MNSEHTLTRLSLLGKWQADYFACIIHIQTLTKLKKVKIVRVIIKYLW